MTPTVCPGQPCDEPCEQGRLCPQRARPFGMTEPMRRPSWALPWAAAFLALQFVIGFMAGAAAALWWVA